MKSCIWLVMHHEGAEGFELERLNTAIRSLDGLANWREGAETIHADSLLFQCEVHRSGVSVLIRVDTDLLGLYIEGDTDLCCDVAIELSTAVRI